MSHNIFALSTPNMTSAICVFRLTGPDVIDIVNNILHKPILTSDKIYYRDFFTPDSKELIDKGLVFFKNAPHSFTGENMVEIQLHGSRAVIDKMTKTLNNMPNLSMAEKGEFSKRAFLNNKIDILQAEALLDLIHADTDYQRRMALEGMGGHFSNFIETLKQDLFLLVSLNSAMIDFAEDEVPETVILQINVLLEKLKNNVHHFLNQSCSIADIKDGLKVVVMGAPNAGKSSFINAILQRDAVIVSDIAGTTRDILEFFMDIEGYPFKIIDTAGLRKSSDIIETEGIRRAMQQAEQADIILFLHDPIEKQSEFYDMLPQEKIINIITKCDLHQKQSDIYNQFFHISANKNININKILKFLALFFKNRYDTQHKFGLSRVRYEAYLKKIYSTLLVAQDHIHQDNFFLFTENIRIALSHIEEITCKVDIENILGQIFSNFCIGK